MDVALCRVTERNYHGVTETLRRTEKSWSKLMHKKLHEQSKRHNRALLGLLFSGCTDCTLSPVDHIKHPYSPLLFIDVKDNSVRFEDKLPELDLEILLFTSASTAGRKTFQ